MLWESLACRTNPDDRLRLLLDYLRRVPDPDRGFAMAALAARLPIARLSAARLKALAAERVDAQLLAASLGFVGDGPETAALVWPQDLAANRPASLAEVVDSLAQAGKAAMPGVLAGWLDRLATPERRVLLRLASGARLFADTRAIRRALALLGGVDQVELDVAWHDDRPPYAALFAWLAGRAARPAPRPGGYRPLMQPPLLDEAALPGRDPADYLACWQGQGQRALLAAEAGIARLYSADGEDLSAEFRGALTGRVGDAALDGEVVSLPRGGTVLRVLDALRLDDQDVCALPFVERRTRLAAWLAKRPGGWGTLAPTLAFADWADLRRLLAAPAEGAQGIVLIRRDGRYRPGEVQDDACLVWRRPAPRLGAVVLYAHRLGTALAELTIGAYGEGALLPVGRVALADAGAERQRLVAWIRDHAIGWFGPTCQVAPTLVVEIAYETVSRSARHKAGLTLTGARLVGVRWQAPVATAVQLAELARVLPR